MGKDKKGGGKGKKAKLGGLGDGDLHYPALLTRQLDQEQIETLDRRVEELRAENDALKAQNDKSQHDGNELMAYFQREASAPGRPLQLQSV